MKEEEVRNTFYCRTEYAAFKEAYRRHRDNSSGWCRGNDVLPCSCDSCQDDLVEGEQHAPSSSPTDGSPEDDGSEDSRSVSAALPPPPPSPYVFKASADGEEEEGQQDGLPSPVGAVFQDDSSTSGSDEAFEKPRSARPVRAAVPRRPGSAHGRSRPWGVGSVPIAAPPASMAPRRSGGLDDWGAASRVREAVKCHGEGYAYSTLRHQGFSDLYIKTHFLPDS